MGDLTDNFSAHEFACKCPDEYCDMKDGTKMDGAFIQTLQIIREVYKKPIKIRSGLRCKDWNEHEGGEEDSAHTKGLGADLGCLFSRDRYELLPLIRSLFPRIGIGKDFIHVDMDESKDQDVMWVY